MKFDIITIFPELFKGVFNYGIVSQAKKRNLLEINIHDLRDFTHDKHKQVDDRPFGGGPGMILKPEPLFEAVESLRNDSSHVIFMTPQGKTFNQEKAEELSLSKSHLIIICGRYEGIDQRVRKKMVDDEISIGSYVLSGGEIPAMVIVDAICRLVPGVILNEEFNDNESFSDKEDRNRLDHVQYTRPEDYKGMKVPEVLLSGNHKKIKAWREMDPSLRSG